MKILNCISLNYKQIKLDIRKSFAFDDNVKLNIMKQLTLGDKITQCILLCTCNRTEVYFDGSKKYFDYVINVLSQYSNVSKDAIKKYAMFFENEKATFHLFKVTSGIDSMVMGEDEILSQTRSAYMFSKNNNFTSYEFNMIFQKSFECAKIIKNETPLSTTSISVATLVGNVVSKLGDNTNVLVIGASGKIGTTVVKNLLSHKNINVKITMREHNKQLSTVDDNIEVVPYSDRYNYVNNSDCIVSATKSPHYTVTKFDVDNSDIMVKSRLLIDLAVPPDIDSELDGYNGFSILNIDHFEEIANYNNKIKESSVESALKIIGSEIDELKKDIIFHSFLPKMKNMDDKEKKVIYKMKSNLSSKSFEEFISVYEKES